MKQRNQSDMLDSYYSILREIAFSSYKTSEKERIAIDLGLKMFWQLSGWAIERKLNELQGIEEEKLSVNPRRSIICLLRIFEKMEGVGDDFSLLRKSLERVNDGFTPELFHHEHIGTKRSQKLEIFAIRKKLLCYVYFYNGLGLAIPDAAAQISKGAALSSDKLLSWKAKKQIEDGIFGKYETMLTIREALRLAKLDGQSYGRVIAGNATESDYIAAEEAIREYGVVTDIAKDTDSLELLKKQYNDLANQGVTPLT